MKTALFSLFFIFFVYVPVHADMCDDQIAFEVEKPIYVGYNSIWADLKFIFNGGVGIPTTPVTDLSPDFQKPGVCFSHSSYSELPHEAIVFSAPAMVTKRGAKMLLLLGRSYSLNFDSWIPNEKSCLHQIETLRELSEKYFALPASKLSFSYQNEIFEWSTPAMLFPALLQARSTEKLIVVRKSNTEYCAFRKN